MGLDITAYADATRRDDLAPNEDDDWPEYLVKVFLENGFDRSFRGLESGWYLVTGTRLSFRAGSYSGYNAWRAALCRAALDIEPATVWDDKSYADKPFYELIHFSDAEGYIGPEACADLYVDFVYERDRVYPLLGEYEQSKYDEWQEAFRIAKNTGLVEFH